MSADTQNPLPEPKLCSECGMAPAICFICEIIGGEKKTFSLCDACESKRSAGTGIPRMGLDSQCFYCGQPASHRGMNQQWESSRGQIFHDTCTRCFQNYHDLFSSGLAGLSRDLPPGQQLEQMTQLVMEIDHNVRAMANQAGD